MSKRQDERIQKLQDLYAERTQELNDLRDAVTKAVEAALQPHTHPYPQSDNLRPGNWATKVPFYCSECRTSWPCRSFYEIRQIYADATGWEPAGQQFEPLYLTAKEEPEDGSS